MIGRVTILNAVTNGLSAHGLKGPSRLFIQESIWLWLRPEDCQLSINVSYTIAVITMQPTMLLTTRSNASLAAHSNFSYCTKTWQMAQIPESPSVGNFKHYVRHTGNIARSPIPKKLGKALIKDKMSVHNQTPVHVLCCMMGYKKITSPGCVGEFSFRSPCASSSKYPRTKPQESGVAWRCFTDFQGPTEYVLTAQA